MPSVAQRAIGDPPPPVARARSDGLPPNLQYAIQAMSGVDVSDVRVHRGSAAPARIGALAYASGRDIALAPGEERQLPHEAWHVVQQRRGRVPATGTVGGMLLNDDPALEREASQMGQRAAAMRVPPPGVGSAFAPPAPAPSAPEPSVVQRVRAGIEVTEDSPTKLFHYPKPTDATATALGRVALWTIGGQPVSAFEMPTNLLGANDGHDKTLFDQGKVALTNDVFQAEWVIKRHEEDVPPSALLASVKSDVDMMFALQQELVTNLRALNTPGTTPVMAPGDVATLGLADFYFYYDQPGVPFAGKAQITVEYTNKDTIERLNQLNASKFLLGTKVPEGEDASYVSGTTGEISNVSSIFRAAVLMQELAGESKSVKNGSDLIALTSNQVALVKFMVFNDAVATAVTRYDAALGQGQDKNIQRFFPKARRDTYVTALSALVDQTALNNLKGQLLGSMDKDAAKWVGHIDFDALPLDNAAKYSDPLGFARARTEKGVFKNDTARRKYFSERVFGDRNSILLESVERAINAYTDTTVDARAHWRDKVEVGGSRKVGTVIGTTRGFTRPLDNGAVYEFREREVPVSNTQSGFWWMKFDGRDALFDALSKLLTSAQGK